MRNSETHTKRKVRIRSKIVGTKSRPRLSVYRSSKYIYAQLIDDAAGTTLVSASDQELGKVDSAARAGAVGELLAKKAKAKKISKAIFDRGAYKYHGQVKNLAEGARKGGLKF
ncbi:50S ribosomal protein L18 [Candidatus Woesebacteria bacterium]|nr:50S ribosomal protein L18 [Candidatus Woesebacteria bacterium]